MAGAGAVQTLAALPGAGFYLSAGAACALLPLAVRRWRGRLAGMLACLAAGLLAGAVNAAIQAQWRLDDALADLHQNAVARLALRVAELPDDEAGGVRFVGEQVGPPRSGIPRRILVSWRSEGRGVGEEGRR